LKAIIEEMIYEEYQVGSLLGQGATGAVYEVIHKGTNHKYALKISKEKEILRQEAQRMRNIQCRVFPATYDYREGDLGYLIMEYIEGRNLQEIFDAGTVFELEEAVWIVGEVLKGLGFLHRQNPALVYRDLKPANIIIEKSGGIRLIDLGSVACSEKKSEAGVVRAGTYGYAEPEQFWPDMIPEPNWDVYAVGKLLGYLLTGHNPALPPYEVEEYYKNNRKIPDSLKEVLNRSLSKQGQARYEDAEQMWTHLQVALGEIKKKKRVFRRKEQEFEYKKCIWLSEY